LAALQGSPCTFDSNPSSLEVSIDSTTGAVGLTCTDKVSATISGGTMTAVNLRDQTLGENHIFVDVSTSSSVVMPSGHFAVVSLVSGNQATGEGIEFSYTCPGESPRTAPAFRGIIEGTYYEAQCNEPSLSGDYAVTATFGG